jgi:hypothetical protein
MLISERFQILLSVEVLSENLFLITTILHTFDVVRDVYQEWFQDVEEGLADLLHEVLLVFFRVLGHHVDVGVVIL